MHHQSNLIMAKAFQPVTKVDLSPQELHTLVRLAKKVAWCDRDLKDYLQKQGVHIVPARYYCELPTVEEIIHSFEFRELATGAFNNADIFCSVRMSHFVDQMMTYAQEFNPPEAEQGDGQFYWKNPAFSYCDAMAYYCIIRMLKPTQILEIGSGFSTLVADAALKRNGFGHLVLIEPYPAAFLSQLSTVDRVIEKFVQDISLTMLVDLIEQGEIWFIDSTHTVKHGSDCLYIYLKAMPALQRDITIHSHDILLPFPYDQNRLIEKNITWTEQYLLYAYLLDNPRVEVLFGSAYSHKFLFQKVNQLMGGKYASGGGSLWYRLNAKSSVRVPDTE